jgi:hypothetical protein
MTDPVKMLANALTAGADPSVIKTVLGRFGDALKSSKSLEGLLNRFLISIAGSTEALMTVAKGIHPADKMSFIGRVVAARINQLAKNSDVVAELRKAGVTFNESGEFLGNPSALTRRERELIDKRFRSLLRVADNAAKGRVVGTPKALDAALESVDDGTRQAILKARTQVPDEPDLEKWSEALLAKTTLSEVQKKAFRAAIQTAGCQQMADEVAAAIQGMRSMRAASDADKALAENVQKALAEELKQGASISRFREKIADLAPDFAAVLAIRSDEAVNMLIDRLLNILVISEEAKAILYQAFDAEGRRRIFTAMGSFRKVYDPARALRAAENLIGWLYEASKFNKAIMVEQSEQFANALLKVCDKYGFRISASNHTLHFDVLAPGKKTSRPLQATDHLAKVTLTYKKSADVVSAAGESKGVSGILEGEKQLETLIPRTSGKTVFLDGKPVRIGEDLHVHLGEALAKIGIPEDKAKLIVADMASGASGIPFKRVVIYPRTPDVPKGFRQLMDDGTLRIAHDVTRQEMEHVRDAVALLFNLFPRRAPKDAVVPLITPP